MYHTDCKELVALKTINRGHEIGGYKNGQPGTLAVKM